MDQNPYRRIRKQRNLTQKELALSAGVTPQVITNLESGLFYKPPVSVTNVITLYDGALSEQELHLQYYLWVRELRSANGIVFQRGNLNQGWVNFRLSVHKTFRGFCRQLVYQPSMLQEFEERNLNRPSLIEALRQVGLPDYMIGRLLTRDETVT